MKFPKVIQQNRFDLSYKLNHKRLTAKLNCLCEHTSLQNKSNAYINWTTKIFKIQRKFKESYFDSTNLQLYNRHCKNGTKKNGTENMNKC